MGGRRREQDPQDDDGAGENSEVRERDLVEGYVQEHALEASLNEVINKVVADRPEDPFLVLASLLYAKATSKRGIFHVEVKEVLDGLGLPGVLVRVHTGKGVFQASCPSEVPGVPDRPEPVDEFTPVLPVHKQRFAGQGFKLQTEKAQHVLIDKLVDIAPTDQSAIDSTLVLLEDELGRNICLATSLAVCKAGAKYAEVPLHEYIAKLYELPLENVCVPMPLFSIVNAAKYASSKLFVQEIFVSPTSATSFADAFQLGAELNRALRDQLEARGIGFCNVGAFGGFAPQLQTLDEMFQILHAAVEETRARVDAAGAATLLLDNASISPVRFDFGVDFAASEFVTTPSASSASAAATTTAGVEAEDDVGRTTYTYNTDKWVPGSSGMIKSSDEMLDLVRNCIRELGVTTVIDPFAGGDIKSFAALMSIEHDADGSAGEASGETSAAPAAPNRMIGGDPNCRLQIVGKSLVEYQGLEAIQEERAATTIVLQLHQFPTVSRALETITEARRLGLAVILGAAAGQSASDATLLAAFAVGTGIGQVKFGGLASAECVEQYNELLLLSEDVVPPVFAASAFRR